jgi:hypothetical protein
MLGGKRPENGRNATEFGFTRPKSSVEGHTNHSHAKLAFNTKKWISGLLHDRVRLGDSFPMGSRFGPFRAVFHPTSSISGLLHDRVRLDESFSMGPMEKKTR